MTLTIFAVLSLIILSIQAAIPYLVKRSVVFGVTIPERYLNEPQLAAYKKRYTLTVFFLTLLCVALYVFWALIRRPADEQIVLAGVLIQLGMLAVSFALYFYFHGLTVRAKKANRWIDDRPQIKIADLSIRTRDEMLPWHVFLLPILITAGILGYTMLKYDALPDPLPIHWGPDGTPDAFAAKTPGKALSIPGILLVLQFLLLAVHSATKMSGVKLSAVARQASQVRQLMLRKYASWLLFLVSLGVTMLFGLLQLNVIHPELFGRAFMIAAPLLFMALVLGGTAVFAVRVGLSDKTVTEVEVTSEAVTDYDEDKHWVGGIFYVNRNDPSIFVEKRFGVGWTLNFANPIGYLIVLGPIVLILVLAFVL